MSRVTNAVKALRRQREARRRRWLRGFHKSKRTQPHHRCTGPLCGWVPKDVRRRSRQWVEVVIHAGEAIVPVEDAERILERTRIYGRAASCIYLDEVMP